MALLNTPNTLLQLPQYGQQQGQALDILTQRGLKNSNFQGIEDLARKNFQTQTLPSISERFANGNTRNNSALIGRLGAAGANLESQLAALRGQHGLNELSLGLKPKYENIFQPEKEGLLSQGVSSLGNLAGQAGLNAFDKYLTGQNLTAAEKARQEGMKTGGQGGFVDAAAQQAKDVGGGTLAGLAAKASGYGAPIAAGTAAGLGAGYLANKAGVPEDASYGVGGSVGTAIGALVAGASWPVTLGLFAAGGLTAYGTKKLYNLWYKANEGNPERDNLENRMASIQLEGQ